MHSRRIALNCFLVAMITCTVYEGSVIARDKMDNDTAYAQMLDSGEVYVGKDDKIAKYFDEQIKQKIVSEYQRMVSINPDTVGWIYVKDTNINYPVMSGNNNYYLNYTPYREAAFRGSIFLDEKQFGFSNLNLVHGHNMLNGSMFSHLKKFKEKDFFDSHKILIYDGEKFRVYKPQGMLRVKQSQSFKYNIEDSKELKKYAEELKAQAVLKSPDPVTEDNVLLLNTCVSDGTKEHHILVTQEIAE